MWWGLPGPDAAVSRIADAIREGRCVLVETANQSGRGLRSAVRLKLSDPEVRWETMAAADLRDSAPLAALTARFIPEQRHLVKTVSDLANHPALSQTTLWIEVNDDAVAEALIPFFCEFAHSANGRELYERPSLVVEHSCLRHDPPDDLALANAARVRLYGHTDWLDMRLFAAMVLRERFSGDALEVAAGVAASIAVWDFDLVEFLERADFGELMEPIPLLIEYGKEWPMTGSWRDGSCGRIGNRDIRHSALLAIRGEKQELSRRIWKGQVGPLFTFLEERRMELIERHRPVLRVPYALPVGEPIEKVEDLEISHIKTLVDQSGVASREDAWLLGDLKRIRHRLAHLEPVTVSDLNKPSLRPWWGGVF